MTQEMGAKVGAWRQVATVGWGFIGGSGGKVGVSLLGAHCFP